MDALKWRFDTFRKLQEIDEKWNKKGTNRTLYADAIDRMIQTVKQNGAGLSNSESTSLITRLRAVRDLFRREYHPDHERIIRIALHGSMHIINPTK